jgi:hypothetical protein
MKSLVLSYKSRRLVVAVALLCSLPGAGLAQGLPDVTASPLLNWFGGLAIVIAGVIAAIFGRSKTSTIPSPPPEAVYLAGPIAEVLKHLEESARSLRHIEKGQEDSREALERAAREAEMHRAVIAGNSQVLQQILTTIQFILTQKGGPRR